jgi:succinate-acetate transporter protein
MNALTDNLSTADALTGSVMDRTVLESPEGGAGLLYPRTAGGVALSAFGVGISAASLSFANAHVVDPATGGFFVPVALGTGALALLTGGLWEFRAGRMFSGTFGVIYAGFLLSTGLIIQFFAGPAATAAGGDGLGDALGAYLLLWCAVTALLTICAAKLDWPAFLAFLFLALALLFAVSRMS